MIMAKKCRYTILFPNDEAKRLDVVCVVKRPEHSEYPDYQFGVGPYKTKKEAVIAMNWMDIPASKRPLPVEKWTLKSQGGKK